VPEGLERWRRIRRLGAGGQGDLAVRLDASVRAVERSLFPAHRTYQQGLLYPPSRTTRS
jgi:hypothetical protein